MEWGEHGYREAEEVSPLAAILYTMYNTSAEWLLQCDDEAQETFLAIEWLSLSGLVGVWNNNSHRDCEDEQWWKAAEQEAEGKYLSAK